MTEVWACQSEEVAALRQQVSQRAEAERQLGTQKAMIEDFDKRLKDHLRDMEGESLAMRVWSNTGHNCCLRVPAAERELRRSIERHVTSQQQELSTLQAENAGLTCKLEEYKAQARHLENLQVVRWGGPVGPGLWRHVITGVLGHGAWQDLFERVTTLEDQCERGEAIRKILHNQVRYQ
jgi:hypothetical protein